MSFRELSGLHSRYECALSQCTEIDLNIKTDSQAQAVNTFVRKVRHFFEGELRKLRSVTELVVEDLIVEGYELPDGDIRSVSIAQLAEPTVTYFRERAS